MGPRLLAFALTLTSAVTLGACLDVVTADDDPARGQIDLAIAPLSLSGVTRAVYDLEVRNGDGETVVALALDSDRYGASDGSLSYIAPCDASTGDNAVIVTLTALYEGADPIAADTWVDPGPLRRDVRCVANADVSVTFDITVSRDAQQGFFDVAVELSDVFCSAKLDCDDARALPGFDANNTVVVALSCVGRDGEDLTIYLDDLNLTCQPPLATTLIDPSAGPGHLSDGDGLSGATTLIDAAAVYQGVNQLQGGALYWNTALSLAEGVRNCRLTTIATATIAPLVGRTTAEDAVRPYLRWDVNLTDDSGALICGRHPVGGVGAEAGVSVRYTTDGPVSFDRDLSLAAPTCSDGVENGAETGTDCGGPDCPVCPGVLAAPTSVSVEATRSTQLTATVSPPSAPDQTVTWSSADPAIATVDASGLVTGVATGATSVTVTTVVGGYQDSVDVTVVPWVPIAYNGASAPIEVHGNTMCDLHNLNGSTAWAGFGRQAAPNDMPTIYVDGQDLSSCAQVTYAAPIHVKRISVGHQAVTGVCGDACTSACGTSGTGLVFIDNGGSWQYVGWLPRATAPVTTIFPPNSGGPVAGDFGVTDKILVCRGSGGHHRDNIVMANVRIYN